MSPEMVILNARVERGFTVSATEETEENPRYSMGEEIGYRFN